MTVVHPLLDQVRRLRPEGAERVDLVFAVLANTLAIIGFRTVFAAHGELTVGLPAIAAGTVVGLIIHRLRLTAPAAAGLAIVVFLVLGGPIALRHRAIGGILPSPAAVTGLVDGIIEGWIRLLTTLPPADGTGDLAAIPYLCGYVGAVLTVVLALRSRRRALCALPPLAVLVVGVLVGTDRPASLLLQGVVFAMTTMAWLSLRHDRDRRVVTGSTSRSRLTGAVGLLGISAVGGILVGPHLPGASPDRYVLRDEVVPPFLPLTEPSPLAAYRNYTDEDHRDEEILTVTGLPVGGRIRIAAMDRYNGLVWQVSGDGSPLAGEFRHVGAELPTSTDGISHDLEITIRRPHGVWVPLAGDVADIDFRGERAEELTDALRVNVETDTAAVPDGLREGDRYRLRAVFSPPVERAELVAASIADHDLPEPVIETPPDFDSRAADWARGEPEPYSEMLAIAEGLRTEGAYTDGGEDANPVSPPGHGLRRLLDFITVDQPFGNGEQFAAAQGLLAQARNTPVRVVMGFVQHDAVDEVTFRGADVEAWIEVPVAGHGWVPIDGTPPEDQLPDPIKQPRSKTDDPEPQPPPPTTIPPPTTVPDDLEPQPPEEEDEETTEATGPPVLLLLGGALIGPPLVFLALPAGLITAAKRRRRNRRRTGGEPAGRIIAAFDELVDLGRDLGAPVPARTTRTETVAHLDRREALDLARRADDAGFGAVDPTDEDAEQAWRLHDTARAEMLAGLDRPRRIRTTVNPTSLRRR